jgi:hypothetical protein
MNFLPFPEEAQALSISTHLSDPHCSGECRRIKATIKVAMQTNKRGKTFYLEIQTNTPVDLPLPAHLPKP